MALAGAHLPVIPASIPINVARTEETITVCPAALTDENTLPGHQRAFVQSTDGRSIVPEKSHETNIESYGAAFANHQPIVRQSVAEPVPNTR